MKPGTGILYTTLIWSAKIFATLKSHIQALKLYIFYYIDIYLKDVILALSWEQENSEN